jgi:hypothetical protein
VNHAGGSAVLSRLARDGYVILSIAFLALRLFQVPPWDQSVDAYAYWTTRDGDLYGDAGAGVIGAYVYSPAFALLIRPLVLLPWPLFVTIWTAFNLAAVWWLLGRWSLPAMLFLPIPFEIVSGNVHLLYAVAIVAGFRASWTWGLPLITKVTPGIGVLWFAVRRAWRPFLVAVGVTGAIVLVSVALDAQAWRDWMDVLTTSSSTPATVGWFLPVPLLYRLPVAVVVLLYAALTERRWLVPAAVVVAMPVLWLNSLAVLAACVPLWHTRAAVAPGRVAISPAEAFAS